MRSTLILALLAFACGLDDEGFAPPPVSPDTEAIGSSVGVGPMGVLDAGEAGGESLTGPSGGGGTSTSGPDGVEESGEASTSFTTGVIGGVGRTCVTPGQTCEGDGECVVDMRTSQFMCSHGGLGEPCVEGSACQEGLTCAIDSQGGQFVCAPA